MRVEHRRRHVVRGLHLPPAALHGHDLHARGRHRILETKTSLLAVECGRYPLDDRHLVSRMELPRQRLADAARSGTVVRADKWHLQPFLLQHLGIEPVVDVDDKNPRVAGTLQRRDHGFRVGRRDDDRINPLRHHLLDQIHLLGQVGLVLDAVDDEVVTVSACAAWCCFAPSAIVLKNSFASDFMISATLGLCDAVVAFPPVGWVQAAVSATRTIRPAISFFIPVPSRAWRRCRAAPAPMAVPRRE